MENEVKKIDLGSSNGWREKPEAYKLHVVNCEGEKIVRENLGRCYNRYSCPKCGITYTVDSSD